MPTPPWRRWCVVAAALYQLLLLCATGLPPTASEVSRHGVSQRRIILVDPSPPSCNNTDSNTDSRDEGNPSASPEVVRTLELAAARVATLLRQQSDAASSSFDDIVVRLAPGVHAVPPGGLRLTAAHTPKDSGQTVRWMGEGAASVSSAVPVTGWQPAVRQGLPSGTVVAPAPAALKGASVRHLWVDGRRAPRTRRALVDALGGGSLELHAAAGGAFNDGYSVTAGGGGDGQSCAADHGKDTPCCGQPSAPGTKVDPRYQCPASAPTCIGYVYEGHWGHCSGRTPPANHSAVTLGWGANADTVEFVYSGVAQGWSEARCAVKSVQGDGTADLTVVMQQPCFW